MMDQVTTNCQPKDRRGVCKWLMWLLMVNIISLSLGVLTKAMYIGFMNSWLQIVCSMGALFCLFQLRREHKLYIVAIIFCSIDLIGTLVQTLLFSDDGWRLMRELYQEDFYNVIGNITIVISRILLISGLAAGVFEYLAHNRLIKTTDQRLSKYWIWLTVGMLILFAAMRVMDWIVADMLEKETLDIEQYQKLNPLMNLPALLLRIGYVVCLFLTWRGKAREEAALLCEEAEPCTEEERKTQKKRLYIALGLGAIGITLICVAVALAIASIDAMGIIGGADWPVFRFILSNGENGLYAMMISFGCAAILASVIVRSKSKRLKNAAILLLPLLLFQILRVPYDWLNKKVIVVWLGCGCPQRDAFGNYFTPEFNANHFTGLFWLFIAICTTVISFFTSGKVLKNKKWLRILYIVGMLLISLLVARRYYYMMFWN